MVQLAVAIECCFQNDNANPFFLVEMTLGKPMAYKEILQIQDCLLPSSMVYYKQELIQQDPMSYFMQKVELGVPSNSHHCYNIQFYVVKYGKY